MRTLSKRAAAAMALALLAACASVPKSSNAPGVLNEPQAVEAATRAQAERAAWLDAHSSWTFEGRVAIANAGKGGSGRIDWQQEGARYEVALSAPVTRQSWRLIGDPNSRGGRLEGMEGGPREGDDAEALLLHATGWAIPVGALDDWVRGLPSRDLAPGELDYSDQRLPRRLAQGGWTIDYLDWFPAAGAQPALPRRIDARRGDATVRLIVDRWDVAAP